MELLYQELENGIRLIKLIGKLDMSGVIVVESKFVLHCAGSQVKVIVDLSKTDFIAPSGGQLLLWTAKEVAGRGGMFVLANPISAIEQTLQQNGFQEWVPIYPDIDTAVSFLLSQNISRMPNP